MLYSVFVGKDGNDLEPQDFYLYNSRHSYENIIYLFNQINYQGRNYFTLGGLRIYVKSGELFIGDVDQFDMILLKDVKNNSLIVDKTFEKSYPTLYKKFKPVIQSYSDNKWDIVYSDYCGSTKYEVFEKPKFTSLKERGEFINSLIDSF